MKTTIIGSWHLASVYAIGLATLGHEVRLVAPSEVISDYKEGKPPVFEPGVAEGVNRFSKEDRLSFSSEIKDPANAAEVCFLAEDCKVTEKGIDLESFQKLFIEVASTGRFSIIAISSQAPLGTCRSLAALHPEISLVYFPEFLRLGNALKIFLEPDYMVFGGDEAARNKVAEFFSSISAPKFFVTWEEAEMAKHAANTFVATSVSFMSELTKFSEQFNVDLTKVGEIMRHDKRIGPKAYVMPGMGFSGETVERDLRVLLQIAREKGISLPLFEQVIAVNNEHNLFIEKKIDALFPDVAGKKIGFLGATYKPHTSTLRGSLFAALMEKLADAGATVALYDPHVEGSSFLVASPRQVFENADALVISVSKKEFSQIPYGEYASIMKRKIIIDAANLLEKKSVQALRLDGYFSIGRGIMA